MSIDGNYFAGSTGTNDAAISRAASFPKKSVGA
jgi:hypothetical protein